MSQVNEMPILEIALSEDNAIHVYLTREAAAAFHGSDISGNPAMQTEYAMDILSLALVRMTKELVYNGAEESDAITGAFSTVAEYFRALIPDISIDFCVSFPENDIRRKDNVSS